MSNDLNEEWRRLTAHYAGMLDGELLQLARDYSDLTEVARQVLRDEMLKRGLGDPLKPEELQQTSGRLRFERGIELDGAGTDEEGGEKAIEYTWKTELCECDTSDQAWQVRETLSRANIQSWLFDPRRETAMRFLDRTPYRILVAADQLDEARVIVAQPIPQDIVEESQIEIPEYETPGCPGCGDREPTLLEADPVNRWGCDVCGKEWMEATTSPGIDRSE